MNNVRKFRTEKGWSQRKLSEEVGVARQTVNMIENNKYNPSLAVCTKIATALETDLNSLFWNVTPEAE